MIMYFYLEIPCPEICPKEVMLVQRLSYENLLKHCADEKLKTTNIKQ